MESLREKNNLLSKDKKDQEKALSDLKDNWNTFLNLAESKLGLKNKEILDLNGKIKELEDIIKNLSGENEKLNKRLLDFAKDKNVKDDLRSLIEENTTLSSELEKFKKENAKLKEELESLKKELERLNDENEQRMHDNERLTKENLKLQKDINRLKEENDRLLADMEKVPNKYELESLKRKIKDLENEINRLRDENEKLNIFKSNNKDNTKDYNNKDNKDMERLIDENQRLKKQIDALNDMLKNKVNPTFDHLTNKPVEQLSLISPIRKIPESVLNESFSERNYLIKKEENDKLKNELMRQKEEMLALIKELNELKERLNNIMANFGLKRKLINESSFSLINLREREKEKEKEIVILEKQNVILQTNENLVSNSINSEMTQKMQFEITKTDCSICCSLMEKFNELKLNLKNSTFKELKNFYISYHVDIDKASSKLEEVLNKITLAENQFLNENNDHKTKTSKVKEILSQIKKLVSILGVFIGKYNKEIYFYTQNLKKIFDFVGKVIYNSSSDMNNMGSIGTMNNMNNMQIKHSMSSSDKQILKVPKFEMDMKRNNLIECKNK